MRWRRGPEFAEEYGTYYALFDKRTKREPEVQPVIHDDSLRPRFWNPETKAYDLLAEWDPIEKKWVRPDDDLAP